LIDSLATMFELFNRSSLPVWIPSAMLAKSINHSCSIWVPLILFFFYLLSRAADKIKHDIATEAIENQLVSTHIAVRLYGKLLLR